MPEIETADAKFEAYVSRLQAFIQEYGRGPKSAREYASTEEKQLQWWVNRMQSLYKRGVMDNNWYQTLLEIPEMRERVEGWEYSKPIPTLQPPRENWLSQEEEQVLEALTTLCGQLQKKIESVALKDSGKAARETVAAAIDIAKKMIETSEPILAAKDLDEGSTLANGKRSRFENWTQQMCSISWASTSKMTRPADWACDQLLLALQRTRFRRQKRRNVTRDGGKDKKSYPFGCLFGLVCNRKGSTVMSRGTKRQCYLPLMKIICQFVQRFAPEFLFSSIQVNKNAPCCLHVDGHNLGPSMAITVGKHTNGELYVHGRGKLSLHNDWAVFDGNVPHLTCPFEGERYVLVFYTTSQYDTASKEDIKKLKSIGFQLPAPGMEKGEYPPKPYRLREAIAALPADLADCTSLPNVDREEDEGDEDEEEDDDVQSTGESQGDKHEDGKEGKNEACRTEVAKDVRNTMANNPLMQALKRRRLDESGDAARAGAELQKESDPSGASKCMGAGDSFALPSASVIQDLCDLTACTFEEAKQALIRVGGDADAAAIFLLSHGGASAGGGAVAADVPQSQDACATNGIADSHNTASFDAKNVKPNAGPAFPVAQVAVDVGRLRSSSVRLRLWR